MSRFASLCVRASARSPLSKMAPRISQLGYASAVEYKPLQELFQMKESDLTAFMSKLTPKQRAKYAEEFNTVQPEETLRSNKMFELQTDSMEQLEPYKSVEGTDMEDISTVVDLNQKSWTEADILEAFKSLPTTSDKRMLLDHLYLNKVLSYEEADACWQKILMVNAQDKFLDLPIRDVRDGLRDLVSKLNASNQQLPAGLRQDLETVAADFEAVGRYKRKEFWAKKLGLDSAKIPDEITEKDWAWFESRFGPVASKLRNMEEATQEELKNIISVPSSEKFTESLAETKSMMATLEKEVDNFEDVLEKKTAIVAKEMETTMEDFKRLDEINVKDEMAKNPELAAQLEDELKENNWFQVFDDQEKLDAIKVPPLTFDSAEDRAMAEAELAARGLPDVIEEIENPPAP